MDESCTFPPEAVYPPGYTPIELVPRFSQTIGNTNIFIKRDDSLGLTGGRNKTRRLEFLVAESLEQGADTLITCGAVQSNHCRLTLTAGVKEGLKWRLVLEERVPGSYNPEAGGNNLLFQLLAVEKINVVDGGSDMVEAMEAVADEIASEGRKAYIIPGGSSNPVGATGYVACAEEVLTQLFETRLRIDRVVCASRSGGTRAGLVTGLYGNKAHIPVVGINVSRTKEDQEPMVYDLVQRTAAYVGVDCRIPRKAVLCF